MTDMTQPPDGPGVAGPVNLSVDQIVSSLSMQANTLADLIKVDNREIEKLQQANKVRRDNLRQVKRLLTAAKPRQRAKATPKAAK